MASRALEPSVGIVMRHVGLGQSASPPADAGTDVQAQRALERSAEGAVTSLKVEPEWGRLANQRGGN